MHVKTHGHACRGKASGIYHSWAGMIQRCTDPNHKNFAIYSKLGLFDEWRDFTAFLAYMGPGKKGWTIERVNNKIGYFPENMVWATRVRQSRNQNRSRIVTFKGITAHYKDLCELFKIAISPYTIKGRLSAGWSVERAFTEPPRRWLNPQPQSNT